MLSTNTWIRICCSLMINAVLFGAGVVAVLSLPALASRAAYLIPVVVVLSFVVAPFLAKYPADRMRIRFWGGDTWKKGDAISG